MVFTSKIMAEGAKFFVFCTTRLANFEYSCNIIFTLSKGISFDNLKEDHVRYLYTELWRQVVEGCSKKI